MLFLPVKQFHRRVSKINSFDIPRSMYLILFVTKTSYQNVLNLQFLKASGGNFGLNINILGGSIWKKCLNTHRQQLVSNLAWEYREISLFCLRLPFYFPISALFSKSPLPTIECLQLTPSVGSSSSWDRIFYSAATFPAAVLVKLELKEGASTKVELFPKESQATANISLLSS